MGRLWNWIVSVWWGAVWATDKVLHFYLRVVNPKYAATAFLVLNTLIAAAAFFFTASWNDFYTVSGYWVTLTGFLVAIGELYRARTMAEQVREAIRQDLRRQRGFHYRFCLERAKSSLAAAEAHVLCHDWIVAVVRLNDLIETFSYIGSITPTADDRWKTLARSAQGWVGSFRGGQKGRKLSYSDVDWHQFTLSARDQLDSELAPFQFGAEVENAAQ